VHILLSLLYELGELALFLVQKAVSRFARSLYAIIAVNFVDLSRAIRRAVRKRKGKFGGV
tara:strand:+ start:262 stop:441 length:180 start_codon:yes stop_codon:yes gene_type:complete